MSKHEGWLELESDPGVFTLLSKALGVQGVQVEEIYDLNKEVTDHAYGFIFLFCWSDGRRSRRRQSAITEDMQIRDERRLNRMFFARQIISNSCATHALLSVVLNSPDVLLGETLSQFKNNTRDMDAETKGFAIGNVAEFAEAHNRHSRPEPISIGTRQEVNGPVLSRSAEAYHYISFVPIDGRLVELDGLKAHPVDHGPIPEGQNWTVRFCEVMKERLGSSIDGNQDIRYNLLAVVDDRIEKCQRRLQALDARREKLLTSVEQTFCSLVCTPAATPYETPTTPVREQPSFLSAMTSSMTSSATGTGAGTGTSLAARAFPSATHALVSEPLATLHESHEQPVCPAAVAAATATSFYPPLMPVTMPPLVAMAMAMAPAAQPSIAVAALGFHAGGAASSPCDPVIAQSVATSNLQLSCATAGRRDASALCGHDDGGGFPAGAVALCGHDDDGGFPAGVGATLGAMPPSPLQPAPGVDPVRVSAALHSSGAVDGGAKDAGPASTELAPSSPQLPPMPPLSADQPRSQAQVPQQRQQPRPGGESSSSAPSAAAFQGLATLAMLAPSPSRQRSPVQHQLGLSELARSGTNASSSATVAAASSSSSCSNTVAEASSSAVADDTDPVTLCAPKVSVTRSSSPDLLRLLVDDEALLATAESPRRRGDTAAARALAAITAATGIGGGGNEDSLLRSSCEALVTSLFAYGGDGGNPAATLTPGGGADGTTAAATSSSSAVGAATASGVATPAGLLLEEQQRGVEVTRAAHMLINVLRQCSGSSVTAEQLPGASIKLEDAAAPLRRDDPESHVRVKAIFREIGEIDGETAACRKLLAEEESKRQRYKVDHSRRTHNYGPFISTFLVMLAKKDLLQPAIEAQHPARFQQKRSGGAAVASSGGSGGSSAPRGKKKSSSASAAAPVAKRARPGRPPGSKTKKKGAKAAVAAGPSGSLGSPPD